MPWYVVYFFVTSQIYPANGVDPDAFAREHARQTCMSYNASFFDAVVQIQRSGKKYGRTGYLYTARCYLYDFSGQGGGPLPQVQ